MKRRPMMFIKKAPNSHGWVNPRDVQDLWLDHFEYFYREEEDFVFPVTVHPDVCGHPHGIFMLERYVDHPLYSSALTSIVVMQTDGRAASSRTSISMRASSG